MPFYGDCELQIQINTRSQELKCPADFSDPLKDLLSSLLHKDPNKRPTAMQIIEHPWFIVQINEVEEAAQEGGQ